MQLPKTSAPGHSRHPPDNRTENSHRNGVPEYGHAARWHARSRDFRILTLALRDEWVPSELIGIVASAKEYQADYEKRTRELRLLGWDYKVRKARGEGSRVRSY